ncbi:cytochrome c oxidase subunit 3 [Massilia sp. MB5]|uniref:cytochrome c oxidase subunit 3 n=1 Tax=Massilia sp. MB5 TaxID=2919578 RepID=UPI001F0EB3EB|nr:cytochrome c oxidase subunit 3 [Massilia sp. MB5]UMR30173.1 cytochrome c oxidase subunit 3 [Massilia sp. MB5]
MSPEIGAGVLRGDPDFPLPPAGGGDPGKLPARPGGQPAPRAARKTGLWVFMAVVLTLFMLFGVAYVMRMAYEDWRSLPPPPWQLWLSTALLAASGAAWELARLRAVRAEWLRARGATLVACLLALAFLGSQLWAWQALVAMNYPVAANPSNSFFYLITALHGVHLLGGLLVGGGVTVRLAQGARGDRIETSILLCARYWHFLFLLWLGVFGLLFYVTPDLVQAVCTSLGIPRS